MKLKINDRVLVFTKGPEKGAIKEYYQKIGTVTALYNTENSDKKQMYDCAVLFENYGFDSGQEECDFYFNELKLATLNEEILYGKT